MSAAGPHLLVAPSGHGFGHLAQVAPVVAALRQRCPDLRLTLRSPATREQLARWIAPPFTHQPAADDFGMVMHTAVDVDRAASRADYAALHRQWPLPVAPVARALEAAAPDLILADIPYLTLAAAAQVGVPSVALCSLNWAEITAGYFDDAEAAAWRGQMREAYNHARWFLQPAPSMPMPGLTNTRAIGPIARRGRRQPAALRAALGLRHGERLVLVALGGIAMRLPVAQWPRLAGVHWLVPQAWRAEGPDFSALEAPGWAFPDLLASCDAVLTKPGYGTFAEAAAAGTPLLYLPRGDWPEEPPMVAWQARHSRCHAVARETVERGHLGPHLAALWAHPRPQPVAATGAAEAAEILAALLPPGHRRPL